MMRIKSISIKNYRQYEDLVFNFNKTKKHDLHLIIAENGIGKTTLLNAINWCLYGDEPHITLKSQALPMINLKTFRKMGKEELEDVSVSVVMESSNGSMVFIRGKTIRKTEEEKDFEISQNFKVFVNYKNEETKVYEGEEAKKHINKIIPFRIRKFFFFDGEQLNTYFTKETGIDLEQSIFEICQIDLLKKMERNLDITASDYRREISKFNPHIKEINNEYDLILEKIEQNEENINNYTSQLNLCKNELAKTNNELGDEPDIAELENERNSLKEQIEEAEVEFRKAEDDQKEFIREFSVTLNALPRLKNLYNTIQEKDENKQLPPKIDRDELEKMVKSNNCAICNRELNDPALEHIKYLLKRYELSTQLATLLTSIRGNIQTFINEAKKYPEVKRKILSLMRNVEEKKEGLVNRYNDINSQLERYSDKERIILLQKKRLDLEGEMKKLAETLVILKHDRKGYEEEKDKAKEKLDKEINKQNQHKVIISRKNYTEKAQKIVTSIIEEIKDGVRSKINNEIQNKFFELIWKGKTFSRIELSESYLLSLYNIDGLECLGSCSAAERALLALAFTIALHKESGYEGPLVVDSPIRNISGILREKFAKVLGKISKEKQIILFLTKDEYSIQVRDEFDSCASNKCWLYLEDEDYVRKEAI